MPIQEFHVYSLEWKAGKIAQQKKSIFLPQLDQMLDLWQFTVKADVKIESSTKIRAGYSANAEIEIESKDSVLVIKEALLQFNRITEKPFVEVLKDNGNFEIKKVEIGLSDGINVEITEGVEEGDEIKVWNKASEENNEEEEDE